MDPLQNNPQGLQGQVPNNVPTSPVNNPNQGANFSSNFSSSYPTTNMSNIPNPHKHTFSKWFSIVVIILIVIVVGAFAGFAYVEKPIKAITKSLSKLNDVDVISQDVRVELDSDSGFIKDTAITVYSLADVSNVENIKIKATFALENNFFNGKFDLKLVDNVFYGRVYDLGGDMMNLSGQKIPDIWYSIPIGTLDKYIKETMGSSSVSIGEELKKSILSKTEKNNEMIKRIVDEGVIINDKFIGFGNDDGKFVKKYSFEIKKDSLVNLIIKTAEEELKKATTKTGSPEDKFLTENIDSMKEEIMLLFNQIEFKPVNFRVSMFSGDVTGFDSEIIFPDPMTLMYSGFADKNSTSTEDSPKNNMTIKINSNYNTNPKYADFSIPEGAFPLESVLEKQFNYMNSTSSIPGKR